MLLVLFSRIFKLSPTCLSPVICFLAVSSMERLGQDPLKPMTTLWGREPLRQGLALISHWVLVPSFHEVSYQGELDDSPRAVFAWTRGENRLFFGGGGFTLFLFPRLLSLCSLSFKYGRHWGRNYGVSPWLLLLLGRAVPKGWCSPQSCVEQRIPGKKKKRAFSFSVVSSLEFHSPLLGPILPPLPVSIRAAPQGVSR